MKKVISAVAGLAALGFATGVSAAGIDDMVGKWTWEGYTIDCTKGGTHGISCKVAAGPKNVGMEMIQSALAADGDAFKGKIKHPATAEDYNAKMKFEGGAWSMDGCTAAGACASGKFTKAN
ncbi:MAG: hypothetical protein NW217_11180 [Hyphomicrobiaceae bacterium]|nr:hypothetical protein [Hyphomicrobiaceae bacterium]